MFHKPTSAFKEGYWTGSIEKAAAQKVSNLPSTFKNAHSVTGELSNNTPLFNSILTEMTNIMAGTEVSFSASDIRINQLCELQLTPKPDLNDHLNIAIYAAKILPLKNAYFYFCVDKNNVIQGLLRINYKSHSISANNAYTGEHFSIEGIESRLRRNYSLGTVLIQLAIEEMMQLGYDGKLTAYSNSNSTLFYHKMGFNPTLENAFNRLNVGSSPGHTLFFLTEPALTAWKERISSAPLLQETPQHRPFKK